MYKTGVVPVKFTPPAVSARLGHSQTSTTTNIYAHALQSADRRAADLMEDIFKTKLDKPKNKRNSKSKGAV